MRRLVLALTMGAICTAPAFARDVTFSNTSIWDIHRIFVSPCGSHYWGPNRLGATEILAKGASRVIAIEGTCSDVKIVDEDGDVCVTPVHDETELALTKKFLTTCQNQR